MSSGHLPARGLLWWYPPAWRERYGDELAALLEDELGGRRPPVRLRAQVAVAGLRERAHEAGLAGGAGDDPRQGCLRVLYAWALFVVAGTSFVKAAEHFREVVPPGRSALASGAYDAVFVLAVTAGLAVAAGLVAAVPAVWRSRALLRPGPLRRRCLVATAVTVVAVIGLVGVVLAAHSLSAAERNGGSPGYGVAAVGVAAISALALALWTATAASVGRQVDVPGPLLAVESRLGMVAASAMVLMTAATAVWWVVMASSAPWFLSGTRPGSTGSLDPNLIGTMILMVAASAWGVAGAIGPVRRCARSAG